MTVEPFHSIDEYKAFRERAYSVREETPGRFRLKQAVINPVSFLPLYKYNTPPDFFKNIEMICAIGAKQKIDYHKRKNDFLSEFSAGMHFLYNKVRLDPDRRRPYVAFSSVIDLQEDKPLAEAISKFEVDTDPHLHITAHEIFSYGAFHEITEEAEEISDPEDDVIIRQGVMYKCKTAKDVPLSNLLQTAFAYERKARSNTDLMAEYEAAPFQDPADSLGRFFTQSSSIILANTAKKHYLKKPITFVEMDPADGKYKTTDDMVSADEFLKPLTHPHDLLKMIQIVDFAHKGAYAPFGHRQMVEILPELQRLHDKGATRYTARAKKEHAEHFGALQQELLMVMAVEDRAHQIALEIEDNHSFLVASETRPEPRVLPHPALNSRQIKVLKKLNRS